MYRSGRRLGSLLVSVVAACGPSFQPAPTVSRLSAASNPDSALSRPVLVGPNADTNDAMDYYQRAAQLIRLGIDLDTADMALYWASRLDPAMPDPLYARALVILRALGADEMRSLFQHGSTGGMGLTPRQEKLVDSLMHQSWARNPFLYTDLNASLLPPFFPSAPLDPAVDGWRAYTLGNFARAESLLAVALRLHPGAVALRMYRAQSLAKLGRLDSSAAELRTARDTIESWENVHLSPILPSLEMLDYAIGILKVNQDDFALAREEFALALKENLGFSWAHVRLAGVDLSLGDTATSLSELDMAVQIEQRDPALRLYHGFALRSARRYAEAADELRMALQLDPYYAQPHYQLALLSLTTGDTVTALEHFRRFMAMAARRDPDRPGALRILADLAAAKDSR